MIMTDAEDEMSKYKEWIKTLPCCHCQNPVTDAHHIIGVGMGKMGGKAHDLHAMPLCRLCHHDVHQNAKSWPQVKWMIETQLKAIEEGILKL